MAGKLLMLVAPRISSQPDRIRQNFLIKLCHEFYFIFLLAWIFRSFLFQPYKVPTGSLEPTILPGDFILVKQFAYALNFPAPHKQLVQFDHPHRGDIVLLRYPLDEKIVYVKRVIGLPGDQIEYTNKTLKINGKPAPSIFIDMHQDQNHQQIVSKIETLPNGVAHKIQLVMGRNSAEQMTITIPEHQYFVMGDNRDNSQDSRYFGLVDEEKIIGKAEYIWLSLDESQKPQSFMQYLGDFYNNIRTERIGRKIV